MPTPTKGPRLGGGPAHERLMLANLATSLFEHDRITTTEAKAKRLRPLAERLITFAKRGDLHARRQVMTVIRDKDVVHKLFAEIGPKFATRPGGYTRIIKTGPRKGDNAPMAVIELVEELTSIVAEAEKARGHEGRREEGPDRPHEGARGGRRRRVADRGRGGHRQPRTTQPRTTQPRRSRSRRPSTPKTPSKTALRLRTPSRPRPPSKRSRTAWRTKPARATSLSRSPPKSRLRADPARHYERGGPAGAGPPRRFLRRDRVLRLGRPARPAHSAG